MFENLPHLILQQYWWIIISILGATLVFLMFVQGGQTLVKSIGKTDSERAMLINATGRKWDLTFTTLVTFGGAFFASFPLFYSTSFGGAYWIWIIILFSFIIQAVSYEYRTKPKNFLGTRTFDTFLFINGLVGTIFIGVAVGTFFTGSDFSIDKMRLADTSNPVISQWGNQWHGLEGALNLFNVVLGLSIFFLARILGALYFINAINDDHIHKRSVKQIVFNTAFFLLFFLTFVILLLTKEGFAVDPDSGHIFMEKYKYLHNFLSMPLVLILFLGGILLVLYGIFSAVFPKSKMGIWYAGTGTFLAVLSVFLIAGFNNTAYYPSVTDLQSSLTIKNSSSSHYTLTAMSYISLFIPFVIAYIWYAWKQLSKNKIDEADLSKDDMKY